MVRARNAAAIQFQVHEALGGGARALLDPGRFPVASLGSTYLAPQLLDRVTPEMTLMAEETFGPVAGIVRVSGDAEALAAINASRFGLTASIWSADLEAAAALGAELQVGTVFANRCDYLDPTFAWTVGRLRRGASLSVPIHGLPGPRASTCAAADGGADHVPAWKLELPHVRCFGCGRIAKLPGACRDLGIPAAPGHP